jgi:hypothetical protein
MVLAVLCAGTLLAQNKPVEDVNAERNPNLAAAQHFCLEAFNKAHEAQVANKYDMKGHAAKAKELLVQASQEISAADKIADAPKTGTRETVSPEGPKRPVEDINAERNPNLAEAQRLCLKAFDKVHEAQIANKYDMKGHAAKAKQLLVQASEELSTADKIADSAHPGKNPQAPSTQQPM